MTNTQCTYGPQFKTRLDLMGIRFMTDPNPAGAGAGGDAAAQAAAAAAAADAANKADGSTPPWGDDPSKFDPDKAWKLIQNLRTDADDRQKKTDAAIAAAAEKAQKDALAQFGRLLTGEKEPETDPAKLNAALSELQGKVTEKDTAVTAAEAQVKAANTALQVAIHAPALGANTALLLANEQFKTSIASVEPTDEAAIKAAITKAIQANAALKQPPARSGAGDHTGPTVQSLEAQLKAAEEKKDVSESIRLKRAIASARATQG
ncbi:hypothetical protein MN032_17805 [Agromyces atrinae]|uniref:hypothetical protein n=1 Tax=Agromyces atrinae TaxID=592376 RepID=UPI001F57D142|nr:hypothetical protein [Agromyces atrinae]MCI2959544.1 hypothetical protein [Agromyces atrinae]